MTMTSQANISFVLLSCATCLLFFPLIAVYIKLVIFAGWTELKIYMKWIPVALLFIQSLISIFIYKKSKDCKTMWYCVYLLLGYALCVAGDLCLIFPQIMMYISGMFFFMMSYFVFGVGRIYIVHHDIKPRHKYKLLAGVFLLLPPYLLMMFFLLKFVTDNELFSSAGMIIAICIYSIFIIFAVYCNYIYLVVKTNCSSVLSFIGIILFALSDIGVILHDVKFNYVGVEAANMILYWLGLIMILCSIYNKDLDNYDYQEINTDV